MSSADGDTTTVCAIMKNEGPYILEWVAYYRMIGFDHIVIYSNDTNDGSTYILDRLAERGVVDHRNQETSENAAPQISAYQDALAKCQTRWICYLDADEFLLLKKDNSISEYVGRFGSDTSAIGINWRLFGSSGHLKVQPGLVIERFQQASKWDAPKNQHIKTIAKVEAILAPNVHSCRIRSGMYVNSSGEETSVIRDGFIAPVRTEFAQVNHYVVKSRQEFGDKISRGNATLPKNAINKFKGRDDQFFLQHDLNDEVDKEILRYAERLHQEISKLIGLINE